MRDCGKEKMLLWMISPLSFPQVVERKVENLKILGNPHVFPLLKNSHLFNIFSKTVFHTVLVFTYSFPLFPEKRSSRKSLACVSTIFFTFFPFPHRIFSRISTLSASPHLFHKIQKVFLCGFPLKTLLSVRGKV